MNDEDLTDLEPIDARMIVIRERASYDVSQDRNSPQNVALDTVILINNRTGEAVVINEVQTVANYPLTAPDGTPAPDSFPDTIAATDFQMKYITTTNVAAGDAGVITNTRTITGNSVNAYGYTENEATPGRTLVHSNTNPTTNADYNTPYSKACIIPKKGEDNVLFFDTLARWGAKKGDIIPGHVYVNKSWESGGGE
ncbi:hypothetical protein K7I13_11525 [Brucepastera parasyntrophica]|uniref:hypothetical protein n=1 Tax=Brucepastera parasyntrophica TaxID=2880008 RepID=UPI002109AF63|nr:hypothetical protein [Brucepastera parasyntrophica]ULQ59126.1 hypothetical protein K7I13_11525 [Brucepastera parasyntrophica]